jgi:hypothetical protein
MLDRLNPKILVANNRVTLAESETGIQRRSETTINKSSFFVNTDIASSWIQKKKGKKKERTPLEQIQLQQRSLQK